MADDTDEVLELDSALEIELEEDALEGTDEGAAGEETEEVYDFGEEGAAPAQESSVIRDLRNANRALAKKVNAYERQAAPQPVEVGPKPTLETCGYDEEAYEAELLKWNDLKAEAKRQATEAQERAAAKAKEWEERERAYEANKREIRDPRFAEAEEEVLGTLSEAHVSLIMLTDKPAALIAALHRNPDQLENLSKLDLARAAMVIGKLEDKVQMRTRPAASPERRVTGNTGFAGGTDKQLERLEREAERTGNRTALIAYRKKLTASKG